MRTVHATNRDAVAILAKNKKMRQEVAQLKHALTAASAAQRDAEERERLKKEESAAVVQQLMTQLQEKEALLAAGAGAMSEEEREEMLEKERKRAKDAADKERKKVEAAAAEEIQKAVAKAANLAKELTALRDKLDEVSRESVSVAKKLEREKEAHAATADALTKLEHAWERELDKRERLAVLEVQVKAATSQITRALGRIRTFLKKTDEHLSVDLCCVNCTRPLDDPQVLVPCGHSICRSCNKQLEDAVTAHNPAKYCPICEKQAADGASAADASPVEGFANLMLDLVLQRLRTKAQDAEGLTNEVKGIFSEAAGANGPGSPSKTKPAKQDGTAAKAPS